MTLNQPYYIDRRRGERHVELDGVWDFFAADEAYELPTAIGPDSWCWQATMPNSVFLALQEAGVLPDPYVGTNSHLYRWVDEKVWYFRRRFTVAEALRVGNAFLCFDGVAYYSRVWVNGVLLGDHEGMFGGPVCDVLEHLHIPGDNELIVEVKACNYGCKESFNLHNSHEPMPHIVPWNVPRDTNTSNGDFIVMGLWNAVRLELTDTCHISRPYIHTKAIDDGTATLQLELEIAAGDLPELHPYYAYHDSSYGYTFALDTGLTGAVREQTVELHVTITEPDTGRIAYSAKETVPLNDYSRLGMNEKYHELQFHSHTITVENTRLWYPNGMGEAYLYEATIAMYKDGELCDTAYLPVGIRTFTARSTAGKRYRTHWGNFRFSVNGQDFFLKGVNWAPFDFQYNIDPAEYAWCLQLAKNAGVQLLRVWSGGGMPETDAFYDLCDRLGILVWQDHFMANNENTSGRSHEVLESQEAYNLYRIRKHPSLVIHCGGNEFNPYRVEHAASMYVIERVVRALDPSRLWYDASPNAGSAHIYIDMEPVWYRHRYKDLPFVAESGIHSLPSYRSLRQLIREEECNAVMPDLTSPEFREQYPELLNHFTEYNPSRIPRMLSRASQIHSLEDIRLEEMCEATAMQAYEFYQLMIQAMRENYPHCGGVMPWVFKRPWATAGVQLVDGMGQPTPPYYAMMNAYKPIHVCLCQQWSVIAPGERVPLEVKVLNENNADVSGMQLRVTVYKPDMTVAAEQTHTLSEGERAHRFADYVPDESCRNTCFLVCAELDNDGAVVSRAVYYVKCTDALADEAVYRTYRSAPTENLYFRNGPWLKPGIAAAQPASLRVAKVNRAGNVWSVTVENTGDVAAYPVTFEPTALTCRYYADDNVFLLKPGEQKTVVITCDKETDGIQFAAWNAAPITATL